MTHLERLQESLADYRRDQQLANSLRDLKLTPAWKALIEDAYQKELANQLVSGLVSATPEQKEEIHSALMGISGLNRFFQIITNKGEVAMDSIRDTENAINELLGEERHA